MKKKANPAHFQELDMVLTMAEAVREYNIHRQTLTYAIDANLIAAVRCGRAVLISKRSLLNYIDTRRS